MTKVGGLTNGLATPLLCFSRLSAKSCSSTATHWFSLTPSCYVAIRTGALFFGDRNILPESKKEWLQKILPKPISQSVQKSRVWTGESGHVQESGVVVDK